MNKLSQDKQKLVLSQLVEGASIRSIERITGIHRDTIMRLLVSTSEAASDILDQKMKNIFAKNVQIDEIWTFVGTKQRHIPREERGGERGDQWVFVALDAETKLVPSFLVGKRNFATTEEFISDLAGRIPGAFQLSSDSLNLYTAIIPAVLGDRVDYGQVHKEYAGDKYEERRYSPAQIVRVTIRSILGEPAAGLISTSYIERQNLTMRMSMRRFTRLSNGFSKKLENLRAAVTLHFYNYNFMRFHSSIGCTPAQAAGLTNGAWGWEPILN